MKNKSSLVLSTKSVTRALFITLFLKIFAEFLRKQSPKEIDKYNKLRNKLGYNLYIHENSYCTKISVYRIPFPLR